MKVRHKRNIDDRIYDDCVSVGEWYIQLTHGIAGHHKAFHNSDYEPMQSEPHWQDVTGECEVVSNKYPCCMQIEHNGIDVTCEPEPINEMPPAYEYRIRKVTLPQFEPIKNPSDLTPSKVRCAFIIERKVNP